MRDMKTHQFFSGIPVTEDGKIGSKLLGIVTRRGIDFIGESAVKLSEVLLYCHVVIFRFGSRCCFRS